MRHFVFYGFLSRNPTTMDGSSSAVFCSECHCSLADSLERLEKVGSDAVDNLCGSCSSGRSKGIESVNSNSCAIPFLDPSIVESIDEKDEGETSTHPEPPTTPSSDNRNIKANLRRSTSVSNNDNNNTPKLMLRNKNVKMKNTKNKVLKILPTKGKSRRHTLKRNVNISFFEYILYYFSVQFNHHLS